MIKIVVMQKQVQGGFLIALEGGEGAGKTTQVAILVEKLKENGYQAMGIREPGGDKIAEQIREVVLKRENTNIADRTETLLFMAARAQVYAHQVLPALEENKVVVMDRTRDSSVVYQGMIRGQGVEMIEQLNDIATREINPDLKILLDIPVKVGFARLQIENYNRMEDLGQEFHEKVRQGYLELAANDESGKWVVIDGTLPPEEVAALIWKVASERLN